MIAGPACIAYIRVSVVKLVRQIQCVRAYQVRVRVRVRVCVHACFVSGACIIGVCMHVYKRCSNVTCSVRTDKRYTKLTVAYNDKPTSYTYTSQYIIFDVGPNQLITI